LEKKRVWRPTGENKRVRTPRMENKRVWRPRCGELESGDLAGRAEQECHVQKAIKELHRTLDSAVNFGPGEEGPHLGSRAAPGGLHAS